MKTNFDNIGLCNRMIKYFNNNACIQLEVFSNLPTVIIMVTSVIFFSNICTLLNVSGLGSRDLPEINGE